jgi:hypothetical protein
MAAPGLLPFRGRRRLRLRMTQHQKERCAQVRDAVLERTQRRLAEHAPRHVHRVDLPQACKGDTR